jgi:hypothetical protein
MQRNYNEKYSLKTIGKFHPPNHLAEIIHIQSTMKGYIMNTQNSAIARLMRMAVVLILISTVMSAHTWEIGVKVTNGTSAMESMVCLKKVGGGYQSGHTAYNQFSNNVNWATDINDGGNDCNSLDPNLCNGARVTATGTYRLYCAGNKYIEFTINAIPTGGDIAFEFNTTTNQWSLLFNGGSFTVGNTGTENGIGCAEE